MGSLGQTVQTADKLIDLRDPRCLSRNLIKLSQINGFCMALYILTHRIILQGLALRSLDNNLTYHERLRKDFMLNATSGVISTLVFLPLETLRIRLNLYQMLSPDAFK